MPPVEQVTTWIPRRRLWLLVACAVRGANHQPMRTRGVWRPTVGPQSPRVRIVATIEHRVRPGETGGRRHLDPGDVGCAGEGESHYVDCRADAHPGGHRCDVR